MNTDWPRSLMLSITALFLFNIASAQATLKGDGNISVSPKVPEKQFSVPTIASPQPPVLDQWTPPAVVPMEAAIRLQAAAKDVRLLEVWSLDPDPMIEDDKDHPSRLVRFHGFRTIGREELKRPEDIQKLLHAVILSAAHGPEEAMECFIPRHGLRIHGQKGFIDVIVCYQCEQGEIRAGEEQIWFTTTKDAEPVFDSFFVKLGLRKAK